MTITTATVSEEEAQHRNEAALKKKDEGNAAFKEARYNAAVVHYTASLRLAPSHLVFGNRAQAYIHLAQYELALRDLNAALALEPTFAKNSNRRAKVLTTLGLHSAARADNAVFRRAVPRDKAAQAEEEALRGKVNARYVDVKQWNSGEEFEEDEMIAIPIEGLGELSSMSSKSPDDLPDIVIDEEEKKAADAPAAPSTDTTLDEETAAAPEEEEEAPAAKKEDTVAASEEGTVSGKDEEEVTEAEDTVSGAGYQHLDSSIDYSLIETPKYADEEEEEEPEEEPQQATVPYHNTLSAPPPVAAGPRETTVGDMMALLQDMIAPAAGPDEQEEDTVAEEAPEDPQLPPASPAKSSSLSSHTAEAPSDRTNSTASWEHVKNDTFESDISDSIPAADGYASDSPASLTSLTPNETVDDEERREEEENGEVIPATPNESSDDVDDEDEEVTGEEPKEEHEETASVTSIESDDEKKVTRVEKKKEEEESDEASVTPNDSGDENDEKMGEDKEEKKEEGASLTYPSPNATIDDEVDQEKEKEEGARGVELKEQKEKESDEASLTSANATVDEEEKEAKEAKEEQKQEKAEEVASGVTAAREPVLATVAKSEDKTGDTVVKEEEDTVDEKMEEEEEERAPTPVPTVVVDQEEATVAKEEEEEDQEATVPAKQPTVIPAPATKLHDFCAHFAQLKHDPAAFGKYFLSLPPASLHGLFTYLLEVDHLKAVVDGLTEVAKEDAPPSPSLVSSALLALSFLPRFDILVMFLSDEERDKALALVDSLPPSDETRLIRANFSQ